MTDSDAELFLSETHPASARTVVLSDDGVSAWAYLTGPGDSRPIADVWVYNRATALSLADVQRFRGGPPPAPDEVVDGAEICADPDRHAWSFRWNADGDVVLVLRDADPLVLLAARTARGMSKHLRRSCAWGEPLSQQALEDAKLLDG